MIDCFELCALDICRTPFLMDKIYNDIIYHRIYLDKINSFTRSWYEKILLYYRGFYAMISDNI